MASLQTTRVSLFERIGAAPRDAGVWADFVATYGPTVVQWCRRHGLQHSDAHDVAQDVLLRFWRHAEAFRHDPSRRFRAYLRRIVVSAVADWCRSRREDRMGTGDAAIQAILSTIPAREELARRIEEAFDLEILEMAMRDVEGRVEPRTWEAFRLLAFERLPGAEVAERLGMTVDNAYRARSSVVGLLRAQCAEAGVDDRELGLVAS